jgi:S-DNA-T family DNA segregation ATPase FtsK/SpoIIIE
MRRREKTKVIHPEAKGLISISGCLLILLSLISYCDSVPEINYLGKLGYYTAFTFNYLFGLSSYLLLFYGFWAGWKLLVEKNIDPAWSKNLYFGVFISSISILLCCLSEMKVIDIEILQTHVISESYSNQDGYNHRYIRYNMGGVPFYFLYRDLPLLNFQSLLSDLGVLCTFGLSSLVCLILFINISILDLFKLAQKGCVFIYKESKERIVKWLEKPPAPVKSKALVPVQRKMKEPEVRVKATNNLMPTRLDRTQISDVETVKIYSDIKPDPKLEENFKDRKLKLKASSRPYEYPPLSLLTNAKKIDHPSLEKELKAKATILEETLLSFGIEGKVGEINCGPTITSFEVHPAIGVKVQKIIAIENDIALNMQVKSIRIIAPIPGKAVVGVEVPSLYPQEVGFKEMLYHYNSKPDKHQIPVILGKTVSGDDVTCDLTKMPHCIIAGATGSGKSVCVNTIIMSILMTRSPDEVKLILIDPKKVELTPFSDLPHLVAPVITEPGGAYAALKWVVSEMERRYEILKLLSLRNITSFNERVIDEIQEASINMDIPEKMYQIVMIIDEFADLMMTCRDDLETPIARIAQMARAVGIHIILATQRPSREVITGIIKANFPSRIAFKVASRINSQIIIDDSGAEMLLGNGDMLFLPPTASQPIRAQGAYIRDEDINRVIRFIKDQRPTEYLVASFDTFVGSSNLSDDEGYKDDLFPKAVEIVQGSKSASTTFLQRKLKVGYARAASLIDELEERGVIGPQEGSKPRKVFLTGNDYFEAEEE